MPVTKTLPAVEGANLASLGANWRIQFIQPDGLPLTMAGLEVIDFGAISYKEIFQNVKTILATPLFTAALERTLGLDNTLVDTPINQTPNITVAILQAVTSWEPRCKVMNIAFSADAINGHLQINLQLNINNVIYGTSTPYDQTSITPPPTPEDQLIPGPPGPPGPVGPTGQRGSIWFLGTADPTVTPPSTQPDPIGAPQQNDIYMNTTTGDIFQFEVSSVTKVGTWSKR